MRKYLRQITLGLLVIILSGIFVELGVWQLHRAAATKKLASIQPEKVIVILEDVASAGSNLRGTAYNRLVKFDATYVKSYIAPGQPINETAQADLLVSLARLPDLRGILVVRGLNDSTLRPTTGVVHIFGRLYPRQNQDYDRGGEGKLSRLDPALVAGTKNLNLFDGFVVATSEIDSNNQVIGGSRILAPQLISTVGGFYWQHIAYVITWWFMAILVLFVPFYERLSQRRSKDSQEERIPNLGEIE